MTLTYQERNLANISKLADNTKIAALKWYDFLVKNNIDILIYDTIRTESQQKENVKKGVSKTMKSYHLVGQALDFVPVVDGRTDWNAYKRADIQKAIAEAKRLGFEWGGDWTNFVDRPHLQYNHKGYGTDTFGVVQMGWKKVSGKWYYYINGTKKTGWLQDKGKWYYLDSNGVMETGWVKVKGKWYFLDASGAMKTGWIQDKGKWYYLIPNGDMATGIIEDKGKLYYLDHNGAMATNTKINVTLHADKNGALKP